MSVTREWRSARRSPFMAAVSSLLVGLAILLVSSRIDADVDADGGVLVAGKRGGL